MPNTIYNAPTAGVNAATYNGQATPDKQDTDVWAAAIGRTGVVSGCAVTPPSSTVPTYRASSFTSNSTTSGSPTITIPSAVQTGDFMLIMVQCGTGSNGISSNVPSGWSLVGTAGSSGQINVFSKVAAGSDTGGSVVVTFTNTSGTIALLGLVAYTGGSSVNVSAADSTLNPWSNGATYASAAVTPTVANTIVVQFWADNGNGNVSPPATSRGILTPGGGSGCIAISDQPGPAAGTTSGMVSATNTSGYGGVGWEFTVAVAPQPAMTVNIAAGSVLIGGASYIVPALAGTPIVAADATNPRIDVVTVGTSGIPVVTTGTPAASPVWPAVSTLPAATAAALATVYVPANATSILNANIVDKREIFGPIRTNATRLFLDGAPTRRGVYSGLVGGIPNRAIPFYPSRIGARSTFR